MNKQESKYNIMKIISMLLIIIYHIIFHGHMIENATSDRLKIILEFIMLLSLVHVNSFVLITGYFQHNRELKKEKIVKLIRKGLEYSLLIVLLFSIFKIKNFSNADLLFEFNPLNLTEYWFIKMYIMLYIISPLLNIVINQLDLKKYEKFLLVYFVFFSLLPSLTAGRSFYMSAYASLPNFIFMYMLGAYISKYKDDEKSFIYKISKISWYKLLFCLITIVIINQTIIKLSIKLKDVNFIFTDLYYILKDTAKAYWNPLVIAQSIIYFMLISKLKVRKDYINKISPYIFGVYLLHDNRFVMEKIYFWIKVDGRQLSRLIYIPYIFVAACIIFVIGIIVDIIIDNSDKFIFERKKYVKQNK